MTGYDRLKGIVEHDPRFMDAVNTAFWNILVRGEHPHRVLSFMGDRLCGLLGLSAEIHQNAIVFWLMTSRAKQPACIVVGMNAGQHGSPSAMYQRRSSHALVQVFEGDADDIDVERAGATASHWLETKGRVLLH